MVLGEEAKGTEDLINVRLPGPPVRLPETLMLDQPWLAVVHVQGVRVPIGRQRGITGGVRPIRGAVGWAVMSVALPLRSLSCSRR